MPAPDAFLERQYWYFPVPVRYGPGTRFELANYCRRSGIRRPLLVTDRATASLDMVAELIGHLRHHNLEPQLFSDVDSNPSDLNVYAGIDYYRRCAADGVIAFGGGSGMDAGKAIAFVAAAGSHALWDFEYSNVVAPEYSAKDFAPLLCIPTTAGTGAEVDSGSMITDTVLRKKRCIFHANCIPEIAILDPELLVSLPASLTAWTGCDALVHAIEAFSVNQFHPLCDGIALQAMRLISGSIRQSVSCGDDLAARGAMLAGSCLAGVAFSKGLGLVHAVSHMIGAEYNTHHGLTNAVMLPAVLEFNEQAIADKVPDMCSALGLKDEDFSTFFGAIVELLDDLEIPESLANLGVEESSIATIARKAMTDVCMPTNLAKC